MAIGVVLSAAVALGVGDAVSGAARRQPAPARGRIILSTAEARQLVDHYAQLHKIPLSIARNLVTVESSWRQHARSPVGALGFTQLMPPTARDLRVNPHDPRQNIEGGMRYLAQMYRRFERWELALAAYNTGPGRVARYGGVPPWTRGYVRKIMGGPLPGSFEHAAAARLRQERLASARLQAFIAVMVEFPAGVRRSKLT